jgi:hypothetical protein
VQAKTWFVRMDTDGSEDIDPAELRKEFSRLGLVEGEASNVMSYYDSDGNGKLDQHEFIGALLDIFDNSLPGFKAEHVLLLGFSLHDRDPGGILPSSGGGMVAAGESRSPKLKSVLEISVDSGSSDASIAKLDGEERPNITRCLSDGNSKSRAKSSESQKPRERGRAKDSCANCRR